MLRPAFAGMALLTLVRVVDRSQAAAGRAWRLLTEDLPHAQALGRGGEERVQPGEVQRVEHPRISDIGGDLDIVSAPGAGTTVRARAPVEQWR